MFSPFFLPSFFPTFFSYYYLCFDKKFLPRFSFLLSASRRFRPPPPLIFHNDFNKNSYYYYYVLTRFAGIMFLLSDKAFEYESHTGSRKSKFNNSNNNSKRSSKIVERCRTPAKSTGTFCGTSSKFAKHGQFSTASRCCWFAISCRSRSSISTVKFTSFCCE